MKIHLGGSSYGIETRLSDYQAIKEVIISGKHTLSRDWLGKDKNLDTDRLMTANERSIVESDAVILDASNDSYTMGFQLALSAIYKKPVLLLSNQQMNPRVSPLTLINAKDKESVKLSEYSDHAELTHNVNHFIGWVERHNKAARFNIEIDKKLDSYLTMKARINKTNKAHEIRELIQKDMNSSIL